MEAIKLQSRSRRALGQFVNADRLERLIFDCGKEFEGEGLCLLWRLADWQRTTLQYRKAMDNYDRTLEVVRQITCRACTKCERLRQRRLPNTLLDAAAPQISEQAFESRMSSNFSITTPIRTPS